MALIFALFCFALAIKVILDTTSIPNKNEKNNAI